MTEVSNYQISYLKKIKHHKQFVRFTRILLLIGFLLIWEITADTGIIDSFIFSSPSRIVLCFIGMVKDKSIFLHTGVTLYETILSFIFVTFFSILAAIIL